MNRRRFLCRSGGAVATLAAGGLIWRGNAQDGARNMITQPTQDAIDSGLAFLARFQNADGSFGTGSHHGNVAITALAGLAFMAGGHQPGRGRYGQQVTRALQNLLDIEAANRGTPGYLHNPRNQFHGPMYGHGFATLFLAEVHGMVTDPQLRDQLRSALGRAVALIIRSQNAQGGWRYNPQPNDADLSVTICQIMALRAARNAGISVPKTVADKCTDYVIRCQDLHNTGGFRYQPVGGPPGFARTAAGVVALYSAGVYEGKPVEKGLEYLMRHRPGDRAGGFFGNAEVGMHYYYGHYYAAQAMWIAGGRWWEQWYPAIRGELLNSQNRNDGSWFNGQICPHYCTAMALIILQIPNNYLPILQR